MLWNKNNTNKETAVFNRWVDDFHAVLYKQALWMVGNSDSAEDIVQDTFYEAWRAMGKLKEQEKALAWLLTILRRIVYKEYKYRKESKDLFIHSDSVPEQGKDSFVAELIDLKKAMGQLSIEQRECILLSALHGFSYEEISLQLNIPIGTVMSKISRTKQKLQTLLGDDSSLSNKIINISKIR